MQEVMKWLSSLKELLKLVCLSRPDGKKYEKALEWGVQVVNSIFLADIIHTGQIPGALMPRYTQLNLPNEFDPSTSRETSRILGRCNVRPVLKSA